MRRMSIPEIGDTLVLAQDWAFTLHNEYRNDDVRDALDLKSTEPYRSLRRRMEREDNHYTQWELCEQLQEITWPVTLPAGTVLRVDRIYIRKGMQDFSSLSFFIDSCPDGRLSPAKSKRSGFKGGRKRFWAKLADVNAMEVQS